MIKQKTRNKKQKPLKLSKTKPLIKFSSSSFGFFQIKQSTTCITRKSSTSIHQKLVNTCSKQLT